MKPGLLFRPEARLELLDAQEWYEGNVPGLGEDFAHIVDTALSAIEDAPRAFPAVYGDIPAGGTSPISLQHPVSG